MIFHKKKNWFDWLFTKFNIYVTMLTGGRENGTYFKITT